MAQMHISSPTSVEEVQQFIERQKEDSALCGKLYGDKNGVMAPATGGERALFCITTPFESPLEETLEKAGFKYLTSIKRRYCYNDHESAELKMWMFNW